MASITINLDANEVLKNLAKLETLTPKIAKKARAAAGDELLRLSEKEVPLDEGTLAGTGVSEAEGDDHVVGFNTPYAARLHEHPEYNFSYGRKGKYLEDPIKHNIKALGQIVTNEVKAGLRI